MSAATTIDSTSAVARDRADRRRWLALGVVLLAAFMDFLDASIVAVAVPSIQRDLDTSNAQVQWLVAAYTLSFALLLITGGRLGDVFGRRCVFLVGLVGFTVASALCGAAQSSELLIAARVMQGATGALMVPQVLAMIPIGFSKVEQAKAYGLYGAVGGLAFVGGPLLGGLLIEGDIFGLGWRPIFLINVFVGVLVFAATLTLVKESKASHADRLDLGGVGLVTAALLLLMYPLVQGRELGWPLWIFIAMAASAPVFLAFSVYELRRERRGLATLVHPRLFRQRSFTAGIVTTMIFVLGAGAFFLIYSITLQLGHGFSALHLALTMLPWPVAFIAASGISIKLAPALGRWLLVIGGVILAAGMAAQIVTFKLLGDDPLHSWQLIPAMVIGGFGAGIALAAITGIVLGGVGDREAGAASGLLNTTFQLGSAIGVAVLGVIFFGLLGSQADASSRSVASQLRNELTAANITTSESSNVITEFRDCFHEQMNSRDPATASRQCDHGPGSLDAQSARPAARPAVAQAAAGATVDDYRAAYKKTMWVEVGLFLVAAALSLALPRRLRNDIGVAA
jgi:EmrB/QacA subfamily drug resistance transporter